MLTCVVLALFVSVLPADHVSADAAFTADVYLDGEQQTANLKLMPQGATEALLGDESVGRFFNGMSWECVVSPPFGYCVQHPAVPVLASSNDRPLLQSVEIYFPAGSWRQ